jgi:hypothetical protein
MTAIQGIAEGMQTMTGMMTGITMLIMIETTTGIMIEMMIGIMIVMMTKTMTAVIGTAAMITTKIVMMTTDSFLTF